MVRRIARGKKRREGASSQATSNLIYECIFYKNTNAGLVSKSQIDSRETFWRWWRMATESYLFS